MAPPPPTNYPLAYAQPTPAYLAPSAPPNYPLMRPRYPVKPPATKSRAPQTALFLVIALAVGYGLSTLAIIGFAGYAPRSSQAIEAAVSKTLAREILSPLPDATAYDPNRVILPSLRSTPPPTPAPTPTPTALADSTPTNTLNSAGGLGDVLGASDTSQYESGTTTIIKDQSVTLITSQTLTDNSAIYVTFEGDYAPATRYWLTRDPEHNTIFVHLDQPIATDTQLSWIVLN